MKYSTENSSDSIIPECIHTFLDYLSIIKGKSSNTTRAYKFDLILFLRFMKLHKGSAASDIDFDNISILDIDTVFLNEIKLIDLFAFISFVEKSRNNGDYAKARKVATLKSFFNYLFVKAKTIDNNPASELESPKISRKNPIYLSLEESKSLLKCISGRNKERNYCIIMLFLNCGMRLSELCSIQMSKIKDDMVTITGKGNKERTVYLNEICLKTIHDYMLVRNKKDVLIPDEYSDFLFLSEQGKNIDKRSVERIVKSNITKAGLTKQKYTPHKLRHTAATLMYKYGKVDIRSLQLILGHENVSTTQIYTHVDDQKLREAVGSNPLNNLK